MNRILGFICGLLIALSIPLMMAQVSGPTTRTPRLTIGNPASPAIAFGDLAVSGAARLEGVTSLTNLNSCSGGACGATALADFWVQTAQASLVNSAILPFNDDLVTVTWATGCSNDPTGDVRISRAVDPQVQILFVTTVTCTSDGTDLATTAAPIPAVYRPTADVRAKYTPLNIATVETDSCVIVTVAGNLQWRTGVTCATLPGNVAKVITAGAQNVVNYNRFATN